MRSGPQKGSCQFYSTSIGHLFEMVYKQINEIYCIQLCTLLMNAHMESKTQLPKLTKCVLRFPWGLDFNAWIINIVKLLHVVAHKMVVINFISPIVSTYVLERTTNKLTRSTAIQAWPTTMNFMYSWCCLSYFLTTQESQLITTMLFNMISFSG